MPAQGNKHTSNLVKLQGVETPQLIDIDDIDDGLESGIVEYVVGEEGDPDYGGSKTVQQQPAAKDSDSTK